MAGFGEEDSYRAGLVATELATNLVKHATGGELLVRHTRLSPKAELELIAIDRGPGIADLSRSLADGYSTAGTSGTGLGAIRRLADEFDVHSDQRGTVVVARLREKRAKAVDQAAMEIAGISVAMRGEMVCGDSWQIHRDVDSALIVVADGLGHGLQAWQASSAAVTSVDVHGVLDTVGLLRAMHDGLRSTRGAAAAVADIRLRQHIVKYAGIGNISATLTATTVTRHLVSSNGILGHEAHQFREFTYPWESGTTFVVHSDGLGTHWSLDEYRGLRSRQPTTMAAVLYRDFSRQRDDVTVVVGRQRV
jgi:anti-sigma regulatory factor (Ser/Thr protein kinase)